MTDQNHYDRESILKHDLQQFTGNLERFRHSINRRLIYTQGVQHLAEAAGAFWLVDAIASYLGSKVFVEAGSKDGRILDIHFWKLTVRDDRTASLTARADADVTPFIEQAIEFTDFPMADVDLWCSFDGRFWTLLLPSEY